MEGSCTSAFCTLSLSWQISFQISVGSGFVLAPGALQSIRGFFFGWRIVVLLITRRVDGGFCETSALRRVGVLAQPVWVQLAICYGAKSDLFSTKAGTLKTILIDVAKYFLLRSHGSILRSTVALAGFEPILEFALLIEDALPTFHVDWTAAINAEFCQPGLR
jgi:hypothetical protein